MRALPVLLLLSACAPAGDFPSLRPRAVEALRPDAPLPAPPPLRPASPEVAAQVSGIVARGQDGQRAFEAALPGVQTLVAAAGTGASESWTQAQQAISRLDAERGPSVVALADLDALATALGTQGERVNDLAVIRAAAADLAAVVGRQRETLDQLSGQLAPV